MASGNLVLYGGGGGGGGGGGVSFEPRNSLWASNKMNQQGPWYLILKDDGVFIYIIIKDDGVFQ